MIELAAHLIAGFVLGTLTGLLPGVGPSMILLSAWPILMQSSLLPLFGFYIVLLATSQYFGSVGGILYGVMGEITAAPAVKYGHPMANRGQGVYALRYTAYASLVASVIAVLLSVIPMIYFNLLQTFFTAHLRITVITLLFLFLIISNPQPLLTFVLVVIGMIVGITGFNDIVGRHLVVPTYSVLDGGVPFVPMMIGVLVVPLLIQEYLALCDTTHITTTPVQTDNTHSLWPSWAMIRGSLIGYVSGLIPGVSYTISSNMASAVERKIDKESDINALVSAEAANNSAAISAILPMLIFALPVATSEVLLLDLAEMSGYTSKMAMNFLSQYWLHVIAAVLVVNLVVFWVARSAYGRLSRCYSSAKGHIYLLVLLTVLAIAIFIGGKYDDTMATVLTLAAGSAVGFLIRNFEAKTAGMIAFLLSEQYLSDIYRQFILLGVI